MIAPPPVRPAAWRTPAIALLVASAIYGQWSATPARTASAHVLDAVAWRVISGVANRIAGTGSGPGARVDS